MIMTVLIYYGSGVENEPCAVKSKCGETLIGLKNGLDKVITTTLILQNEKSGDYFVEFLIEEDGKYVDSEDLTQCYCDLDTGAVTWKI